MNTALNLVTALTTSFCAILLFRAFLRSRAPLLLSSALCFLVLTFSYILNWADLVLVPDLDLYTYRLATTSIAMIFLLVGLIRVSR